MAMPSGYSPALLWRWLCDFQVHVLVLTLQLSSRGHRPPLYQLHVRASAHMCIRGDTCNDTFFSDTISSDAATELRIKSIYFLEVLRVHFHPAVTDWNGFCFAPKPSAITCALCSVASVVFSHPLASPILIKHSFL